MQKLVIADDDEIMLQGLLTMFPWNELGIELIAGAEDGEKALHMVTEHHADILLTDIRMPKLDGLALAEWIWQKKLNTTVIIMSAYDDFDYAKRALRLQVVDYLVKPLDLAVLENTMREVIKRRTEEGLKEETVNSLVEENKSSAEREILKKLLLHGYTQIEYRDILQKIPWKEQEVWKILEVCIEESTKSRECSRKIQTLTEQYGWKWIDLYYERNLICCFGAAFNLEEQITEFKKDCEKILEENEYRKEVYFLNGILVRELYYIDTSYQIVETLRKLLYAESGKRDLGEGDLENFYNDNHTINQCIIEYLVSVVFNGWENKIAIYADKLEKNLRSAGSESKIMFSYALSIFLVEMNKKAKELQVSGNMITSVYNQWYKEIIIQPKLTEGMKVFRKMLAALSREICVQESTQETNLIKKACIYIENHYRETDFRVTDVADYIGISSNYFSTLFKEKICMSFTEYVLELRMREAQRLLADESLRSSEVAVMVGYDNSTYFSSTFKKYTGVTVSQFRNYVHTLTSDIVKEGERYQ